MQAILQTLPGLIDDLAGPEVREAVVFAVWPAAIGEQLRDMSAPLRLEDKILFVAVTDREWEREFKQHAGQIIYKLNASLKSSVVQRLALVIDPDAVRASRLKPENRTNDRISSSAICQDISVAATQISDLDLRANFLKAATACIERRDAGPE